MYTCASAHTHTHTHTHTNMISLPHFDLQCFRFWASGWSCLWHSAVLGSHWSGIL